MSYYKAAERAFRAKSYREALELYKKAYAAKPLNGFYYNIGLCYRKLSHHSKAIVVLKKYIAGSTRRRNRLRATRIDFASPEPGPVMRDVSPRSSSRM